MEAEALAGLAGYTQHYYGANSAAATRQTLQDDNDNDDDVDGCWPGTRVCGLGLSNHTPLHMSLTCGIPLLSLTMSC